MRLFCEERRNSFVRLSSIVQYFSSKPWLYSIPLVTRPLSPKATPFIRTDLRCTEIVNNIIFPPSKEVTLVIRPLPPNATPFIRSDAQRS